MAVASRLFPEVYTNGDRPARCGVIDKERLSPTPSYGFGWMLPSVELFHAIDTTDEDVPLKMWLFQLPKMVGTLLYPRWKMKGYWDERRYNPIVPEAINIGENHILILLACNDGSEVIDRVIADKAYHEECRNGLNNPKSMRDKPAWFHVGLNGMPKNFPVVDSK